MNAIPEKFLVAANSLIELEMTRVEVMTDLLSKSTVGQGAQTIFTPPEFQQNIQSGQQPVQNYGRI